MCNLFNRILKCLRRSAAYANCVVSFETTVNGMCCCLWSGATTMECCSMHLWVGMGTTSKLNRFHSIQTNFFFFRQKKFRKRIECKIQSNLFETKRRQKFYFRSFILFFFAARIDNLCAVLVGALLPFQFIIISSSHTNQTN